MYKPKRHLFNFLFMQQIIAVQRCKIPQMKAPFITFKSYFTIFLWGQP